MACRRTDSLSVRLQAIRESNVGLVYGDLQLMTPEGVVYGEQRFPELASEPWHDEQPPPMLGSKSITPLM